MIWCDRVGLIWAAIAGVLLFLVLPSLHGTAEPAHYPPLMAYVIFAGTPWLLLRAIHFVFTGRLRSHHAPFASNWANDGW